MRTTTNRYSCRTVCLAPSHLCLQSPQGTPLRKFEESRLKILHNKCYARFFALYTRFSNTFSPTKPWHIHIYLGLCQDPQWDPDHPTVPSEAHFGIGISTQWSNCSNRAFWVFNKWVSSTGYWTWDLAFHFILFLWERPWGSNQRPHSLESVTPCPRRHFEEGVD